MLDETLWIISLLSDADGVKKNPSLKESSFTLQEAILKHQEYMFVLLFRRKIF